MAFVLGFEALCRLVGIVHLKIFVDFLNIFTLVKNLLYILLEGFNVQ